MSLESGKKLAHYEIVELIGRGGMGEVYRAKDSKLGRDVAIKVLPDELSRDDERLRRFQREAKVLASLNHPNIGAIYGLERSDETHYLVLELVPGETLAERIARGPIPVDEALAIASQIGEALEEAHERGIVHRDLKPANIKLTPDDKVKVLDFGLAKAFVEDDAELGATTSMSPTITRDATRIGVILGTAAYMSPEQAKGKRVDKRADIWAFGVVVYEMLTGQRAFDAEDVSETLAHVLTGEPDWNAMPALAPASLLPALRACLMKDPKRRARDIADVRLAIDGVFGTSEPKPSAPGRRRAIGVAVAAAAVCSLITGVAVLRLAGFEPPPRPVARFSLALPAGVSLTGPGRHVVALSPDGARVVHTGNDVLYLRNLNELESTPVRGSENAIEPFFSPDGEWIGFWAEGELRKVPVRGGAPVSLCRFETPWGAGWGADDTILFGQWEGGIMRVSADGGTPEVLIPLEGTAGEFGHGPQLLPGGRHVLFTLGNATNDWDDAQIVVHSLDTGERKVLIRGGRDARYLTSGHLVYAVEETLFAVPFDLDALAVTAGPVPVAEGVMFASGNATGAAQFSVSDTGTLVFFRSDDFAARTLVWVDRDGREEPLAAEPSVYSYPRISPDGSRLAVDASDEGRNLWVWDFARETLNRFTFDPGADTRPVWSPDGRQIIFESHRNGQGNLFVKSARGAGQAELLLASERHQLPLSMSPDGAWLVLEDGFSPRNLSILSMSGERELEPLLSSEFNETNGAISPDGRFLAYQSDPSGAYEVFVRPFPNVEDGQWQISSGGGIQPRWAPDGGELFFLAPGPRMMAVEVQTEPELVYGVPRELFAGPYHVTRAASLTYDVAPDGKRFLMIRSSGSTGSSSGLTIVLNWFQELERLVPTD